MNQLGGGRVLAAAGLAVPDLPASLLGSTMAIQRCEAYYSGRVQGVGFRYTVRQIAAGLPVTGYVRNLPDGRVELVAEGEAAELKQLLAEIAERMDGYLRKVTVDRISASGEFKTFEIRD